MRGKHLLAVAVVLGVGLVAMSVTADAIGIGSSGYDFGWEQKLGVAVGMAVAWFGGLRLAGWRPLGERRHASAPETQSAQSAAEVSA